MNPKVDAYLAEGCGRCELYQTPQCKVHNYINPMTLLREYLLETELYEDFKWKQPCYTLNNKNVLILTAFKEFCCISFFKGSLLKDIHKALVTPGENSQAARQLRFTNREQVKDQEKIIRAYIQQSIEVERTGAKVEFKQKSQLELTEELVAKMMNDEAFKKAFDKLTPGRQRSWNLHFSSAKQPSTRSSRIEKARSKIFEGKGWNER